MPVMESPLCVVCSPSLSQVTLRPVLTVITFIDQGSSSNRKKGREKRRPITPGFRIARPDASGSRYFPLTLPLVPRFLLLFSFFVSLRIMEAGDVYNQWSESSDSTPLCRTVLESISETHLILYQVGPLL